jgi:hypothetical protein
MIIAIQAIHSGCNFSQNLEVIVAFVANDNDTNNDILPISCPCDADVEVLDATISEAWYQIASTTNRLLELTKTVRGPLTFQVCSMACDIPKAARQRIGVARSLSKL